MICSYLAHGSYLEKPDIRWWYISVLAFLGPECILMLFSNPKLWYITKGCSRKLHKNCIATQHICSREGILFWGARFQPLPLVTRWEMGLVLRISDFTFWVFSVIVKLNPGPTYIFYTWRLASLQRCWKARINEINMAAAWSKKDRMPAAEMDGEARWCERKIETFSEMMEAKKTKF